MGVLTKQREEKQQQQQQQHKNKNKTKQIKWKVCLDWRRSLNFCSVQEPEREYQCFVDGDIRLIKHYSFDILRYVGRDQSGSVDQICFPIVYSNGQILKCTLHICVYYVVHIEHPQLN